MKILPLLIALNPLATKLDLAKTSSTNLLQPKPPAIIQYMLWLRDTLLATPWALPLQSSNCFSKKQFSFEGLKNRAYLIPSLIHLHHLRFVCLLMAWCPSYLKTTKYHYHSIPVLWKRIRSTEALKGGCIFSIAPILKAPCFLALH